VVTHEQQVERRTAKARRPKTDALPLDHVTNLRSHYCILHCCICTRCWTGMRCCLSSGTAKGPVVFTRLRHCAPI